MFCSWAGLQNENSEQQTRGLISALLKNNKKIMHSEKRKRDKSM